MQIESRRCSCLLVVLERLIKLTGSRGLLACSHKSTAPLTSSTPQLIPCTSFIKFQRCDYKQLGGKSCHVLDASGASKITNFIRSVCFRMSPHKVSKQVLPSAVCDTEDTHVCVPVCMCRVIPSSGQPTPACHPC